MMRILAIGLILAAMNANLIQGRPAPAGTEQEVLRVEQARVRALLAADAAALEPLLGDDLLYVHAGGWAQTRKEFLESVRKGELKYDSMQHHDVRAHLYGDAAVLTGRSAVGVRSARRQMQLLEMEILFTAVYARIDGRWQLVVWQSTRGSASLTTGSQ